MFPSKAKLRAASDLFLCGLVPSLMVRCVLQSFIVLHTFVICIHLIHIKKLAMRGVNFSGKCVLQEQVQKCHSAIIVLCFLFNTSSTEILFPTTVSTVEKPFGVSSCCCGKGRHRLATVVSHKGLSLTDLHGHIPPMPCVLLGVHLDCSITHWLLWSCLLCAP